MSGIVGVRQSDPSSKILNCVLQAYPELNIRWLLTGWGEMLEERASDVGFQKLQTQECAECAHKDETVNNLKDLVESLKQDKEDLRDRVKSLKADKQRLLDSIDSATGENSTGKRNSA
ncbi:hypothetical protein [uncultured Draconibacterium sp.]|uniref:hypothetical protein n=1 Tax=uncultured Draconibacterium sp. TaxID=1573823 RepID=UPI0025FC137A|nr:hypothetical protein [uncultured Draconibacterium sp.]